jgi:hypothetical protein
VRAEIVHDRQNLLDVSGKALAMDRPVEHAGATMSSQRKAATKVMGFPVPVRSFGDELSPARRPAVRARHIGFGPGLVEEDEAFWIEPRLKFSPPRAVTRNVRAILFGGEQRFF